VEARANLTHFLQAAHDLGLYVHLRLGPYIDAAWDYGGYPSWINEALKRGADYRELIQSYITKVTDKVRSYLVSNGGPVIMLQIENEWSGRDTEGVDYAQWAIQMALKQDTGVPWTWCNNSQSPILKSYPGLIYTANAAMGPEHYIKGYSGKAFRSTVPLCGKNSAHPDNPCIWTEIEERCSQCRLKPPRIIVLVPIPCVPVL